MQFLPIDHNRDGFLIHDNTLQQLACGFWRDGVCKRLPGLKDTMQLLDVSWWLTQLLFVASMVLIPVALVTATAVAGTAIVLMLASTILVSGISVITDVLAFLQLPCEPVLVGEMALEGCHHQIVQVRCRHSDAL